MLIGSHLSIAGGMHLAIEAAVRLGLDCVQVFTKNQRQWKVKPLVQEEVDAFRAAVKAAGWDRDPERRLVSHNSYLVNLASPDRAMRARSRALQVEEVERCERLGIPSCVMHPGAHLGTAGDAGDEAAGIRRLAKELDAIHRATAGYATVTCIENTVGSGTNLGGPLEHLAMILESVGEPERVALCIDTCHASAYGHDMSTPAGARSFWSRLGRAVGIDRVRVLHVNDSKGAIGSHLDRHEHLGMGTCGTACFAHLAHARALRHVPAIMETPKEGRLRGRDPDRANAAWLRALVLLAAACVSVPAMTGCRPWAKPEGEVAAMRSGVAEEPTPEQSDAIRRAREVEARGDYQEALAGFRSILADGDRLVEAHLGVARTTRAQGDLRAAQRAYEQAVRADPRNVDALVGLGDVHAEAGRDDEAMANYRAALKVQPADMRAMAGIADALDRQGQQAAALPFLERLCVDASSDAASWTRLGAAYLAAGRNADAVAALEEAVAMGEVSDATLERLVSAYEASERWAEAASSSGEFARRWPSAPASERAARLAFRAGDYDRAIEGYRLATEQDPASVVAWNGVGVCALNAWILSDRLDGTAREEARRALERSLELAPGQPQVARLLRDWKP